MGITGRGKSDCIKVVWPVDEEQEFELTPMPPIAIPVVPKMLFLMKSLLFVIIYLFSGESNYDNKKEGYYPKFSPNVITRFYHKLNTIRVKLQK
jgi:hypothetical protein